MIFVPTLSFILLFNRGARGTSLVTLIKRTQTATTHMKKLPTSFGTTACSWLLSGETWHVLILFPKPFKWSPYVADFLGVRSWTLLNCSPPFSTVSEPERFSGENVIYKPVGESVPDMVYLGSLSNFDLTYAWAQDKCVPLVREITFENGEVCNLILRTEHRQYDYKLFVFVAAFNWR